MYINLSRILLLSFFLIYFLQMADCLWDISARLTGCVASKACLSDYISKADLTNHNTSFTQILNNRLLGEGGEKNMDVDIERL